MSTDKTGKIEDAGEIIKGARKNWRSEQMTVEDIQNMTDEEIVSEVKKDHVWPKPDYEKLVEGGMSPEAASFVKIVRDRIAQKPRLINGIDEITTRRNYVEALSYARDLYMSCRTVPDVVAVWRQMDAHFPSGDGSRYKMYSLVSGRTLPFNIRRDDTYKAGSMLEAGFPVPVPSWQKGMIAREQDDGTFVLMKDLRKLAGGFETRQAAFKWAEDNLKNSISEPASTSSPSRKKIPKSRPHLDRVERFGFADDFSGKDVSSDEFIETFGFRGVQFGNWLPNDERQKVLNLGYASLMDLADVLGWDPHWLSLGGTLALAFGSRGRGGNAAAHYEPGQRVVNMTRLSGAGSLAHEFGHALDHWLGTGSNVVAPGGVPSASGWDHRINETTRNLLIGHHGEEVSASWSRLMRVMDNHQVSKEVFLAELLKRTEHIDHKVAAFKDRYEQNLQRRTGRSRVKYKKEAADWLSEMALAREAIGLKLKSVNAASDTETFSFGKSGFYKQSVALGGKDGYWKKPCEMFARSFECWVFDEIADRNAVSQYLVHGVEDGLYAGEDYKGDPYPSGDERRLINNSVSQMIDVVTPLVKNACVSKTHMGATL